MKRVKGDHPESSSNRPEQVEQSNVKRQDNQGEESKQKGENGFVCETCEKHFKVESDLYVHLKQKHSIDQDESKVKSKKNQKESKQLEQEQNDIEDSIYAFLGELGEEHAEVLPEKGSSVVMNS